MEGARGPTPFTGLAYVLGKDGETVLYYGTYEDGLAHGISVYYRPNGQIKNKDTIFHGTGHGWSRQWNQQGRLVFLGEYIHGISVRFREWDEAGKLKEEKTDLAKRNVPSLSKECWRPRKTGRMKRLN